MALLFIKVLDSHAQAASVSRFSNCVPILMRAVGSHPPSWYKTMEVHVPPCLADTQATGADGPSQLGPEWQRLDARALHSDIQVMLSKLLFVFQQTHGVC